MSHKYLSLQVNVYKYLSTSKRPRKQMTARKQHKQMSCQQITPRHIFLPCALTGFMDLAQIDFFQMCIFQTDFFQTDFFQTF